MDRTFRLCAFVVVLPYGNIYRQNTRDPLAAFIRGDDNDAAFAAMKEWSEMKLREVQYVQVAVSQVCFSFDALLRIYVYLEGIISKRSKSTLCPNAKSALLYLGSSTLLVAGLRTLLDHCSKQPLVRSRLLVCGHRLVPPSHRTGGAAEYGRSECMQIPPTARYAQEEGDGWGPWENRRYFRQASGI